MTWSFWLWVTSKFSISSRKSSRRSASCRRSSLLSPSRNVFSAVLYMVNDRLSVFMTTTVAVFMLEVFCFFKQCWHLNIWSGTEESSLIDLLHFTLEHFICCETDTSASSILDDDAWKRLVLSFTSPNGSISVIFEFGVVLIHISLLNDVVIQFVQRHLHNFAKRLSWLPWYCQQLLHFSSFLPYIYC